MADGGVGKRQRLLRDVEDVVDTGSGDVVNADKAFALCRSASDVDF